MTDPISELRANPGQPPTAKVRAGVAAAFADDAAAAWEAYSGQTGWRNPGSGDPWGHASIDAIWAPVASKTKGLVSELKKRTLGFIVRSAGDAWELGYVLELGTKKGQQYSLGLWCGGPPNEAPTTSHAHWSIPADLAAFYAVHDGFGSRDETGFGVESLLASHELEPLPASVGRRPDGSLMIEDGTFLGFLVDSVGNRRGLYRQDDRLYKKAFDWDHETREVAQLSAPLSVISKELVRALRAG